MWENAFTSTTCQQFYANVLPPFSHSTGDLTDPLTRHFFKTLICYETISFSLVSDKINRMFGQRFSNSGPLSEESQFISAFLYSRYRRNISFLCQLRIPKRSCAKSKVQIVVGFECDPNHVFLTDIDKIHTDFAGIGLLPTPLVGNGERRKEISPCSAKNIASPYLHWFPEPHRCGRYQRVPV